MKRKNPLVCMAIGAVATWFGLIVLARTCDRNNDYIDGYLSDGTGVTINRDGSWLPDPACDLSE